MAEMTQPHARPVRMRVQLNGHVVGVLGISGDGVLNVSVDFIQSLPESITPEMRAQPGFDENQFRKPTLILHMGGLEMAEPQHPSWPEYDLTPGDEVVVTLEEDGDTTPPTEYMPPPSQITQPPALPDGWAYVENELTGWAALARALDRRHPLAGRTVRVMATRTGRSHVLLSVRDGVHPLAVVELDGRPTSYPEVVWFTDHYDFMNHVERIDRNAR